VLKVFSAEPMIARASSRSRCSWSSLEPLMSAKSAVTVHPGFPQCTQRIQEPVKRGIGFFYHPLSGAASAPPPPVAEVIVQADAFGSPPASPAWRYSKELDNIELSPLYTSIRRLTSEVNGCTESYR
jgi:hypothetical protein